MKSHTANESRTGLDQAEHPSESADERRSLDLGPVGGSLSKGDKPVFTRAVAMDVARVVCNALKPVTTRLIVAGSLRRGRAEVHDIEILFIPKTEQVPNPADFFSRIEKNHADDAIEWMITTGLLAKRLNSAGSFMYGPKNKLMIHCGTGLPVDLFATTETAWWNYLVARTGPAESNIKIASIAKKRGYAWHPYGDGFSRGGEVFPMNSEQDVFAFVGLRYREPKDRR